MGLSVVQLGRRYSPTYLFKRLEHLEFGSSFSDTWLPVDCDSSTKSRVREKSEKNLYGTYMWEKEATIATSVHIWFRGICFSQPEAED